MKSFSIEEALRYGWEKTKTHLLFFVGIFLVLIAVAGGLAFFAESFGKEGHALTSASLNLMIVLGGIFMSIGLIKVALLLHDGKNVSYTDLVPERRLFLKYTIGSFLYALIVSSGLVLFIVPGIIWSVTFGLYGYLIVDKNMRPLDALKRSAEITSGARWQLFLFGLALVFLNMAGALAFLIGLAFTIPTALVATAFVYRKLLTHTESTLNPHITLPRTTR